MTKPPILFLLIGLCAAAPGRGADMPLQSKIIVVDAGHGTASFEREIINGGKYTNEGTPEHVLTVDIAQVVAERLEEMGATVYLTRTKETYWRWAYNSVDDNKARAVFANSLNADALISIHCDWHPNRDISGVTTLYALKDSARLARLVQDNMVKMLRARDRRAVQNDFTILDHAQMPALIVETGFMSNWNESKNLTDPDYQKKVGEAIGISLTEFFEL